MPAPWSHWPCELHRRLCASYPAGHHPISIHASIPRLPNIWFDSSQLRYRHGYSWRRSGLFGVFPPAATGHHARGWDADLDSTCPDLEISWPGTVDNRLFLGRDVSGVVNADLVLPTAETGNRLRQLASFSCIRTLDPPSPRVPAGVRKTKPGCLSRIKKIKRLYTSRSTSLSLIDNPIELSYPHSCLV